MGIEESKTQITNQDNNDSFSRVAFTPYRGVVNGGSAGSGSAMVKVKFLFFILLLVSGSSLMMANAAMLQGSLSNVGNEHYSKGISNLHSGLTFNHFSRALERIHFGPLLGLRSINSRTLTPKFASELATSNPREKKALSYLSRFYHPVLQPSHSPSPYNSIHGGSLGSSRRRISYSQQHHSGETATFPVGRLSRPIMRLRWGK